MKFKEKIEIYFIRPLFGVFNFVISFLISSRIPMRWLFMVFSRILPFSTTDIRGVKIQSAIPLNAVGIYDTFKKWEIREPEVLDFIDQIGPEDVFFDIGAGFGTESLYAAKKLNGPKKIVCFDLNFISTFIHCLNIEVNKVNNIDIYFVGLGDKLGFEKFAFPTGYFAIKKQPKYFKIKNYYPMITLDDFITSQDVYPTYIKIDVDGYEYKVLKGLRKNFIKLNLKSVFVEVDLATINDCIEFLTKRGFKLLNKSDTVKLNKSDTINLIFSR